jgi:hypothetical protein
VHLRADESNRYVTSINFMQLLLLNAFMVVMAHFPHGVVDQKVW